MIEVFEAIWDVADDLDELESKTIIKETCDCGPRLTKTGESTFNEMCKWYEDQTYIGNENVYFKCVIENEKLIVTSCTNCDRAEKPIVYRAVKTRQEEPWQCMGIPEGYNTNMEILLTCRLLQGDKTTSNVLHAEDIKIGIEPSFHLHNEFLNKLSLTIGNDMTTRFQEIIDDHDSRVVNNTFARIEFQKICTVEPTRELAGATMSNSDRIIYSVVRRSVGPQNEEFLRDIATTYAYNNTILGETHYTDKIESRLVHQKWFDLNHNMDETYNYVIAEEPTLSMLSARFSFIIGPTIGTEAYGAIGPNIGMYINEVGRTFYSFGDSTDLKEVTHFASLLQGDNSFEMGGHTFTVVARKNFMGIQVVVITPLLFNNLQIITDDWLDFKIPVLTTNQLTQATGLPNISFEVRPLNKNLLNKLLIKNLTGKVSEELLTEYGMALSWYSYNKRGVELANRKISPEDVKTHVYVARVLQAREQVYDKLLEIVINPGFPKAIVSMLSAAFSVFVGQTNTDYIENFIRHVMPKIKTPDVKSMYGLASENWLSIDAWTRGESIHKTVMNGHMLCHHHACCPEDVTDYKCYCCGSMTAPALGHRCTCCIDISEYCYHECDMENHNEGNDKCQCCGMRCTGSWCLCCTMQHNVTIVTGDNTYKPYKKPQADWKKKTKKQKPLIEKNDEDGEEPAPPKLTTTEMASKMPENAAAIMMGECDIDKIAHIPTSYEEYSQIAFIPSDHDYLLPLNWFQITEIKDVTKSDCGIDSLAYFIGPELTEGNVKVCCGKRFGLGLYDLMTVCKNYKINIAIADATGVHFSRGNDSENFAVIVHSSAQPEKSEWKNHWLVGRVQYNKNANPLKYANPMITAKLHNQIAMEMYGTTYEKLPTVNQMFVCYQSISKYVIKFTNPLPPPELVGDQWKNSNQHDPQLGLFNIELKSSWTKWASVCLKSIKMKKVDESLQGSWDITSSDAFNVEEHLESAVRDVFLKIAQLHEAPGKYCRVVKKYVTTTNNQSTIDVSQEKLKKGDLVFVYKQATNEFEPIFLDVQHGRAKVAITTRSNLAGVLLYIPKSSYASLMMNLTSYSKSTTTGKDVVANIKNLESKVISGPGGSGKTTMLVEIVKGKMVGSQIRPSILALAATGGGVKALVAKLPPTVRVMSFEKAKYSINNYDLLIVDECTTVFPWELGLVMSPGKPVILLGDPFQISAIDLFASGGARSLTNCLQACNRITSIIRLNKTYRYGKTLVDEFNQHPALADIESACKHDTKFEAKYLEKWDSNYIEQLFQKCDVVLGFYQDHVTNLKALLGRSTHSEVVSVHNYQGLENKIVGVLQCPLKAKPADTHLQFGHCISAATRATHHLIWLSVNCFSETTPLHQRLGNFIGCDLTMCYSSHIPERIIEEQPMVVNVLHDQSTNTENNKNEPSYKQRGTNTDKELDSSMLELIEASNQGIELRPFDANKFDEELFLAIMKEKAPHVTVQINYEGEETMLITWKIFGASAQTIHKTGAAPIMHKLIPKYLQDVAIALVANCCKTQKRLTNPRSLTKTGWYRTRILAAYVKVLNANNQEYNLTSGKLAGTTVKVLGNSCAACAGLAFHHANGDVTNISKDYLTVNARVVEGKWADVVYEEMEAQTWKILPKQFDDMIYSHAILSERIDAWMKDLTHGATGFQNWMWSDREGNVRLQEEIRLSIHKEIEVTNYDKMTLYPFVEESRSFFFVKSTPKLVSRAVLDANTGKITRMVVTRDLGIDLDHEVYLYFNLLVDYTRGNISSRLTAKSYMKKIGAMDDFEMPGLIKNIEWHKMNNTRTYNNVLEKYGKLAVTTIKNELAPCYIPGDVLSAMREMALDVKLVGTNGRSTINDPFVAAGDIALARALTGSSRHLLHLQNNTVYTAYVMEEEGVTNEPFPSDDYSTMCYAKDKPLYFNMLQHHLSRLSRTDPKYDQINSEMMNKTMSENKLRVSGKTILGMSPQALRKNGKELIELFRNWKEVYMWAPSMQKKIKSLVYLVLPGSNTPFEIHEDQREAITRGKFIRNTQLKWHMIKSEGAICYYKLSNNGNYLASQIQNSNTIIVPTPVLITDPEQCLRTGAIMERKNYKYNAALLSNLRRRCLRPGTTWDDLLVQCRTLLNSAQFSTHTVSAKYLATAAEGKATARLAWAMHKANEYRYCLLGMDGDSPIRVKESLSLIIGEILGSIIPDWSFSDFEDLINSTLGDNSSTIITQWLHTTIKTLDECDYKLFLNKPTVVLGNDIFGGMLSRESITQHTREFVKTVILEGGGLYYRNDCALCNKPVIRLAILALGHHIKPSGVDVQGARVIKAEGCHHSKANQPITIGPTGDLVCGPFNCNSELDVPVRPTFSGDWIEDANLTLPKDAAIICSKDLQAHGITNCKIRVNSDDPIVNYCLAFCEESEIIFCLPQSTGISTSSKRTAKCTVWFSPGTGNAIYCEERVGKELQLISVKAERMFQKHPSLRARKMTGNNQIEDLQLFEDMALDGISPVTHEYEQIDHESTADMIKNMLNDMTNTSACKPITECCYLPPRGWESAHIVNLKPDGTMVQVRNRADLFISVPCGNGKGYFASVFEGKLRDDSEFHKFSHDSNTPVLMTRVPEDICNGKILAIVTEDSDSFSQAIDRVKNNGPARHTIATWKSQHANECMAVGINRKKNKTIFDSCKTISDFTAISFKYQKVIGPCNHKWNMPVPLPLQNWLDCPYCDSHGANIKIKEVWDGKTWTYEDDFSGCTYHLTPEGAVKIYEPIERAKPSEIMKEPISTGPDRMAIVFKYRYVLWCLSANNDVIGKIVPRTTILPVTDLHHMFHEMKTNITSEQTLSIVRLLNKPPYNHEVALHNLNMEHNPTWYFVYALHVIKPGPIERYLALTNEFDQQQTTKRKIIKVVEESKTVLSHLLPIVQCSITELEPRLLEANNKLEGKRYPVYSNLLLGWSDRLRKGRNLLETHTMHQVDGKYIKPPPLDLQELKWLVTLQRKIADLKPQSTDVWNIYGMDGTEIRRSPAVTPGRHLAVCKKNSNLQALGFEVIELEDNAYRFFASVRPIIAYLIPKFDTVYLRGGRVGLHILWVEDYQLQNHGKWTGNAVVVPTRNFGPIMDGIVLKTKPSHEMMMSYIASNMRYFDIYGMDEANPFWFDFKECHYIKNGTHLYSTAHLSPEYNNWVRNIHMIDCEESYNFLEPFRKDWVELAFVSYSKTMELAQYIDPELNCSTRLTDFNTLPDIKEYIVAISEKKEIVNSVTSITMSGLYCLNEYIPSRYTRYSSAVGDRLKHLNVEYNPRTREHCARECFEYCISRRQSGLFKANVPQLMNWFKPKKFEELNTILSWFEVCGMNVSILTEMECYSCIMNNGPMDYLFVKNQQDGTQHIMVVEEFEQANTLQKPRSIQSIGYKPENDTIEGYTSNEIDMLENTDLEAILTSDEWKQQRARELRIRYLGAWEIIASRSKPIIDPKWVKIEGTDLHRVTNLTQGKAYCMRGNSGWLLRICRGEKNLAHGYIKGLPEPPHCVIDLKMQMIKQQTYTKKQLKRETSITKGLINQESKDWAIKNDWYADLPVNVAADELYIASYDNCDHHFNAQRTAILDKQPKSLHFPNIQNDDMTLNWKWSEEVKNLLYLSGPVRLGLLDGRPFAVPCAVRVRDNELLNKVIETNLRRPNYDTQRLVAEWGSLNTWETFGNRLNPADSTHIARSLSIALATGTSTSAVEQIYDSLTDGTGVRVKGTEIPVFLILCYGERKPTNPWNETMEWRLHLREFSGVSSELISEGSAIHDPNHFRTIVGEPFGFGPDPGENSLQVVNADSVNNISDLEQQGIGKHQYWAFKSETKELNLNDDQLSNLRTIDSLNKIQVEKETSPTSTKNDPKTMGDIFLGFDQDTRPITDDAQQQIVEPTTMNFWDDETAMLETDIALPYRRINLSNNTEFSGIKNIAKGTMVEYPSHSQPNFTKRQHAGTQAVSELFGRRLELRKVQHDPIVDARLFAKTYLIEGAESHFEQIGFSTEATIEWLKERPDGLAITKEIDKLLADGLDIAGMDKVNVHMKLEARMKDTIVKSLTCDHEAANGMPETVVDQRIRLIVWQQKGITALFAPAFAHAKHNLKRGLKPNVIYTDGYTPEQLSAKLNQYNGLKVQFVEDDLKKQDRQTDSTLIATEMEIYKKLGVSSALVDCWSTVHKHWRAKGIGLKFIGDASRHTGQATTAIGNFIINLVVHMRFVNLLGTNLILMVGLGDDNAFVSKVAVTEKQVSTNSARHFNMVSEPHVSNDSAGYLRMLIYKNNNDVLELGPDFIRMRRRFEVLNGSGITTVENLEMRAQSYLSMLGGLPRARSIVTKHNWSLKLKMWYNYSILVEKLANKYKCTAEHVETEVNQLLDMIDNCKVILRHKTMFTEEGH
jgi:PHD/YefM family antitoxin component YafN of YafNO toxin-antitoxin module